MRLIAVAAIVVLVAGGAFVVIPRDDPAPATVLVVGTVTDAATGSSLDDANLVWSSSGRERSFSVSGDFEIRVPEAAACRLTVEARGFGASILETSCLEDLDVMFALRSHGSSVLGHVTDGSAPIIGASVQARPGGATTTTDMEGAFSLPVAGVDRLLVVNKTGYTGRAVVLPAHATDIRVWLLPVPTAEQWSNPFRITTPARGLGEPSIGADPQGRLFVKSGQYVHRSDDGGATWKDASPPDGASPYPITMDPYLHVDRDTGRVWSVDLYPPCTRVSWSDDAGDNWLTNLACGSIRPDYRDHPGIASGPLPAGYEELGDRVAYLCEGGKCLRSTDGGYTWVSPSKLQDNARRTDCSDFGGSTGKPLVTVQGTLVLPISACGDGLDGVVPGLIVSRTADDDAEAYVGVELPSGPSRTDGFVSADAETVAWAVAGSDFRLYAAGSGDDGATWSRARDVAPQLSSTAFVAVQNIGQQALVASVSTTSWVGDPTDAPDKTSWHLWVTLVEDVLDPASRTRSFQVTPDNDPVQIGSICLDGIACDGRRNLLDFIGMTSLPDGRIAITYADGCQACSSAARSNESTTMVAVEQYLAWRS